MGCASSAQPIGPIQPVIVPIVGYSSLPLLIRNVPFARYSNFSAQSTLNEERIIAVGGCDTSEFYELIPDMNSSSMIFKSFSKDYNKQFASLKHFGLDSALFSRSYLIQDHKYLVVFCSDIFYNVYDMENDKWLIDITNKNGGYLKLNTLKFGVTFHSRDVLINDEMIIRSTVNTLQFYFIGNDHITDPILVHEYTIRSQSDDPASGYLQHGMCVIDFISNEASKINKDDDYDETQKIQIILFGGKANFLSSFVMLDVSLSYRYVNVVKNNCKLSQREFVDAWVNERSIDKDEIKLKNIDLSLIEDASCYGFGYQCFVNSKNETIIVIVGGTQTGKWTMSRRIHLFNCANMELTVTEQVNHIYSFFDTLEQP